MRVWRLVDHWLPALEGVAPPAGGEAWDGAERALRRKTHDTIRRVTTDIEERMHLNTAVSSLMELVNELYAFTGERPESRAAVREALDALTLMLAPFVPHTAEELWERLGHAGGLARAAWPSFDEAVAKADEVEVPVQINGKVRARITVAADLSEEALREHALADAGVQAHLQGRTIRKVIVGKGPLVSVVVS